MRGERKGIVSQVTGPTITLRVTRKHTTPRHPHSHMPHTHMPPLTLAHTVMTTSHDNVLAAFAMRRLSVDTWVFSPVPRTCSFTVSSLGASVVVVRRSHISNRGIRRLHYDNSPNPVLIPTALVSCVPETCLAVWSPKPVTCGSSVMRTDAHQLSGYNNTYRVVVLAVRRIFPELVVGKIELPSACGACTNTMIANDYVFLG